MHKNYLAVRDPARGAYSTPPDLIAGGEGDSCPSLRTPPTLELPPYGPRLAFRAPQSSRQIDAACFLYLYAVSVVHFERFVVITSTITIIITCVKLSKHIDVYC